MDLSELQKSLVNATPDEVQSLLASLTDEQQQKLKAGLKAADPNAGFWFVTVMDFGLSEDALAGYEKMDKEFAAKASEAGFEVIFSGKAQGHEVGNIPTPFTTLVKFPDLDKAKAYYGGDDWYNTQKKAITDKGILRDVRIFEGPKGLYEKGKGYWCAKIYDVFSGERLGPYIGKSLEQAGKEGFRFTTADGKPGAAKLEIKHVCPSAEVHEHGKTVLPDAGKGNIFFDPAFTTDMGMVVTIYLGTHDEALQIRATADYKSSLLQGSFGTEYTSDEDYESKLKTFTAEVLIRDLRIVCVPA